MRQEGGEPAAPSPFPVEKAGPCGRAGGMTSPPRATSRREWHWERERRWKDRGTRMERYSSASANRCWPPRVATRRTRTTPRTRSSAPRRSCSPAGPPATDDELCRWLRTTVKHEALAIRRHHDRVAPGRRLGWATASLPRHDTHERAERSERLRLGAQALAMLKPQEVRCLVLRAAGYSYHEICEETGWSYTKVNRCLTEGRRAFTERVAGIESGAECERLAPLLSALADGEANAAPARRSCARTCAPAWRAGRGCASTARCPSRVAALVPPAVLAIPEEGPGPVRGFLESLLGAAQDRAAALGERGHQAAEMVSAPEGGRSRGVRGRAGRRRRRGRRPPLRSSERG